MDAKDNGANKGRSGLRFAPHGQDGASGNICREGADAERLEGDRWVKHNQGHERQKIASPASGGP